MKILVVTQYFWPENFRINDLCSELQKRGHEITVLTGNPNYPEGKLFAEFKENPQNYDRLSGIEIIRVPMLVRGESKVQLILNYFSFMVSCSTFGSWKVKGRNYDLVFICQLSPATVAIPGLIIACIKGVPAVMWILDLWPDTLKAVGIVRNVFLLKFLQRFMNFVYSRCELIFVQSRTFGQKIYPLIADPTKIHYIPTWAEKDFSLPNDKVPADGLESDFFTVTFAGNIGSAQDIYCIIKAANELKKHAHIRFNIIGDGSEAAGVSRAISQYGLIDNVKMLGRHPLKEMLKFYQEADAMIVTLKSKGVFSMTIPGKLQSYLAAGKAVIGAIDGEAQQVIKESKSGYCVASGDYIALADAILKMSKLTRKQIKGFEENAKNYYEKEFSRSKILDRFENHLQKII